MSNPPESSSSAASTPTLSKPLTAFLSPERRWQAAISRPLAAARARIKHAPPAAWVAGWPWWDKWETTASDGACWRAFSPRALTPSGLGKRIDRLALAVEDQPEPVPPAVTTSAGPSRATAFDT